MELEFYTHQQQQQQQTQQHQIQQQQNNTTTTTQQLDNFSMAANNNNNINNNSSSNNTTTTTGNNNNNNNTSSGNNNNNTTNSNSIAANNSTVTADAATVAIAKNMLQLHHGATLSNNGGGSSGSNASLNNGTNNNAIDASPTTTTSTNNNVVVTTTTINNPPAHVTNSTSTIAAGVATMNAAQPENALGLLKFMQELLYITEPITVIGRNSSTSLVHFHVAENNLVSRKHFQVLYDSETRDFYVQCLSKNGIFVDDFLQRRNADPLKLPTSCFFRFPSTEIRIQFESFVQPANNSAHQQHPHGNPTSNATSGHALNNNNHNSSIVSGGGGNGSGGNAHVIISPAPPEETQHQHHQQHVQQHLLHHQQPQQQQSSSGRNSSSSSASTHLLPMESGNTIYAPLKISIPKKEQKSPYLSPTGTISAANSCPASPRQGFHQNQSNYNNYSNNNLQNQDLFQTPSTASYNHNEKPPYSYAQLIVQAISAAPDKQLTLSGIYSFIVKHYPYYRKETNKGWQNSIRHNLSLNRYFIKVARSQDEPGKGSFWRIDPDSGAKLIDHSYKKRRQRSSQGFRPSYGMPRSAPVSPSHMDNSRESSPLQDIVLQSAPGSPGMSLENRANDSDLMYNSQNMHQQTVANNSHNQYNSGSPYYVSNQNSVGGQQQTNAESGGNGVGALIAIKRNHVMAAGVANMSHHQQQQHQQNLHPDVIYDDMPTDYSGNMESGDDECDAAKRPKYISEVL